MAEFFTRNIITVYFFYGLSFFTMGLAVLLEISHASELDFSRALRPLAGFGMVHGSHEWLEMFLLIRGLKATTPLPGWVDPLRLVLLAGSFAMLVIFGARLIAGPTRPRTLWSMVIAIAIVWAIGAAWVLSSQPDDRSRIIAIDVYTRYSLAIPGAALAAWGLMLQRRNFIQMGMPAFGRDVALAALAFFLYGCIGQLFASPSTLFPSATLNADAFLRWFGFPIQVFRACMATLAAVFITHSLRSFTVANMRQIEALREAQQAERRRLEETRAELLHRTVKAQESERQRIARELHDETGQTLTAIGMGLRGLSETISFDPERAVRQASQLEAVAMRGIDELQNLVAGLHPSQLDDLGLLAALRWYANQVSSRYGLKVEVVSLGPPPELSAEERTVLFRIAQEALSNVVRHSGATRAVVRLVHAPEHVSLSVEDNGQGFDVEESLKNNKLRPCWGLLGMIERATLAGGTCRITSAPGEGTRVEVAI
jgi:signal transduction histidine kinase